MKAEYINPFITSTMSVFETMLNYELTRGVPFVKTNRRADYEITEMIGLSGRASGMVAVSLSEEMTIIEATAALLGDTPPEVNADEVDAVSEIANMIAGGAKAQLETYKMHSSLPTVITGKWHTIGFPSSSTSITIPFDSDWGPLVVDVAVVAESQSAQRTSVGA